MQEENNENNQPNVPLILDRSGFDLAYNLEGGLDAYSSADASVPRY
jgi:hypothetical protein